MRWTLTLRLLIIDGAGHLLCVEPGAENTAHIVLDWIERQGM